MNAIAIVATAAICNVLWSNCNGAVMLMRRLVSCAGGI